MRKTIFIFSGLALAFLALIKMNKFSLSGNMSTNGHLKEWILIISAAVFIILGIVLSRLFQKPAKDESSSFVPNEQAIKTSGLSNRELEILSLMAKGLSNKEIGKQLFISESTVKSHVSNVLSKLNSSRRTQAIQIARDKNILM
ncbi:MAG: response regulator transcription factor [Saprospiraceae bacterium]|nr:response regulator transcription factor [Saprospiraceae bacterium]